MAGTPEGKERISEILRNVKNRTKEEYYELIALGANDRWINFYRKSLLKQSSANISNTEEKSSAIEITPAMIKSTEDAVAKYEVKPKEKKNVVVAYDQEASKEQKQKDAPPPGGNDIPAFDVSPPFMTDQDKMMVLGMRV